MFYLYKWDNLVEFSPDESVRNEWLYRYGAFARYNGIWFPCKVLRMNTIGNPASISVIPIATVNMDIYPKGEILADQCDVLYTVFPNGMSISSYIQKYLTLEHVTDRMLFSGIKRSLNTELLYGPKRLIQDLKRAANREDKTEVFVLETNNKDEIGSIELPRTIDILEELWNSKDWMKQELSQMLGITYNPVQGKKERMITSEALGDRDLTIMNRERISNRLIATAEKFGEKVCHISSEIDRKDRKLEYGMKGEKADDSI